MPSRTNLLSRRLRRLRLPACTLAALGTLSLAPAGAVAPPERRHAQILMHP